MQPSRARRLLAVGLFLGLAGAAPVASQNQSRPWWRSESTKNELGLTADQVTRIDKVQESMMPELRQEWAELQRLEAKLAKTIETSSDEALLARQIDRVETARANLSKTRQLMLVRMRLILTPEQRSQLKTLVDREMARRGDGSKRSTPERRDR
jgi:Spy/CpxP family protein refolding chaperone